MKYNALLRCMKTGTERLSPDFDDTETATIEYMWIDGNYACDCNRGGFFHREHPMDHGQPCGESAYRLVRIVRDDGLVLKYREYAPVWAPADSLLRLVSEVA